MSLSIDPIPQPAAGGALPGAVAPDAPGRLGSPLGVNEAFAYLRDLGVWRDKRKAELDSLDAAALASHDRDSFSRDMLVSMALWKAISDRYDLLTVTFDSGRVGPTEAARLSTLVWGRLDVAPDSAAATISPATSGALGLSLPEACRLCDAMTSSLRARLSLEPSGAEVGTRLKDVRATIERIRDQVALAPAGVEREAARSLLTRLEQRLVDITDRAKRGAEVGGMLAPLELEAAGAERDLIVGAGRRVETARDAARAAQPHPKPNPSRPTRSNLMITVTGLTKHYGNRTAVDDLTFTVAAGRVTGFVGPNGAGKSTTMRMMVGLTRPDRGEVRYDGVPYLSLIHI